jgi:hypothetical protein
MMAVPALGVLLSKWKYGENPAGTEIAGMLTIGVSLALLSWLTLCGEPGAASEIAHDDRIRNKN